MSNDKDIAVVGMACVFPKAANVRQFWSNLANGVDAIDRPPPGRWPQRRNFQLPTEHEAFLPTDRGGFLPTDLPFDPLPFGVPPNLVRHGDPDQFLMLHVLDAALRDAGVAEDSPLRKRTDVIVGRGGYVTGKLTEMTFRAEIFDTMLELLDRRYPELVGPRRSEMEDYLRSTLTPRANDNVSTAIANITASRAANRLNLRGAAYTVDGACASSLSGRGASGMAAANSAVRSRRRRRRFSQSIADVSLRFRRHRRSFPERPHAAFRSPRGWLVGR